MTPALEGNIREACGFTAALHRATCRDKDTVKSANRKDVRDLLQRDVDKAGLDGIHGHDFRVKAITDAKAWP